MNALTQTEQTSAVLPQQRGRAVLLLTAGRGERAPKNRLDFLLREVLFPTDTQSCCKQRRAVDALGFATSADRKSTNSVMRTWEFLGVSCRCISSDKLQWRFYLRPLHKSLLLSCILTVKLTTIMSFTRESLKIIYNTVTRRDYLRNIEQRDMARAPWSYCPCSGTRWCYKSSNIPPVASYSRDTSSSPMDFSYLAYVWDVLLLSLTFLMLAFTTKQTFQKGLCNTSLNPGVHAEQ